KPPSPPSALLRVPICTSGRPSSPKCSTVPRPVAPMTPVPCASSTTTVTPACSATLSSSGSGARSPSMLNTPSVTTNAGWGACPDAGAADGVGGGFSHPRMGGEVQVVIGGEEKNPASFQFDLGAGRGVDRSQSPEEGTSGQGIQAGAVHGSPHTV